MSEMNPKQYELPTPESAELEPLAKALVALRRDETPIAPSAELRRQVEARLNELETNTQGTVITKEKAMLKYSTGRFRLRDWVFFGGGSIAAAVATTIIFWPPPKVDVAKVIAPRRESVERMRDAEAASVASPIESKDPKERMKAMQDREASIKKRLEEEKAGGAADPLFAATSSPTPGGTGSMMGGGGMPGAGTRLGGGGGMGMPGMDDASAHAASEAAAGAPYRNTRSSSVPNGEKHAGPPVAFGLTPNGTPNPSLDLEYRGGHFSGRTQFGSFDPAVGGVAVKTGEQYNTIVENQFLTPTSEPLSTFSIDVDTASYSNIRRFLTGGQLPPPAAVRIEELVNYFGYNYAQPKGKEPFAVNMETAECPWNPGHVLLRVGLKGKEIERKARPASNLVFLLDVSGSMADENKLPLLKTTMTMLIGELTENDRVTIVTYAGDAGLKLEPTSGDQKQKITDVINSLSAGGSTNGSAGIELAYQKAAEAFIKEGTNRVILATDGDLNVGVTSDDALVKLIKEKAAGGTFLTVLGFGEGNLKDGKLEQIADNGNGMYGYIDSVREGRKMMVEQLSGSLVTIAKDVKIQIEFNPAQIQSYRLLGYENRVMAAADFNNDKKDAGEIGAGHTVTALYELVPVTPNEKPQEPRPDVEPLKYQKTPAPEENVDQTSTPLAARLPRAFTDAAATGELLTLKLRYKEPDGVESRLIEFPLKERGKQFNSASKDFQFAAAVASFGMILRGSQHRGSGNASAVAEIAAGAIGEDPNGLRAEFVDLVRRAEKLGIK